MASAFRGRLHGWVDSVGASVGALLYRRHRFFGASLESPGLEAAIRETRVQVSSLVPDCWHRQAAKGPCGDLACGYRVHRWLGPKHPTLLFVHGSGEQPYAMGRLSSNSFRAIFGPDYDIGANLIALMAPFHDGSQGDYIRALGSLANYTGMLSSTTALLDALAVLVREQGGGAVHAVGISLGGWVVNLHRAFMGSNIDRYVPMVAGTRLADVFLTSEYRKLTAPQARAHPEVLRQRLDFETPFVASRASPCCPLLARYDRLVEYQVQSPAYAGMDLRLLEAGHFAAMGAGNALRRHVLSALA